MKTLHRILCPALLLLAAGLTVQAQTKKNASTAGKLPPAMKISDKPLPENTLFGDADDGDSYPRIKERYAWFYNLRAYPNKSVPLNAMQKAWEQSKLLPTVQPKGAGRKNGPQRDDTAAWQLMGPEALDYGYLARVNAIAVNPTTPAIIYIGEAQGGLWKSTDSGTTWKNLTDNLSSQTTGCITLDPSNYNTIYYGTGEPYYSSNSLSGVGIWKSTDGGTTWNLFGNSTFGGHRVNHIVIDPANSNHWFVSSDAGLYVTTDGGATFVQKLAGLVWTVNLNLTNRNILYAAVGNFSGLNTGDPANNGLYKSTDGGNTWIRQTTSGLPTGAVIGRTELDICTSNPNIVCVAFGDQTTGNFNSIWKTTDGGTSWTSLPVPNTEGQEDYNMALRIDPNNPNNIYAGTLDMGYSTNGGASWGTFQAGGHPDHHAIDFDYTHPTYVYMGNDGGIFNVNFDTGRMYSKNYGRGSMEYYAFDVHPTDPNQLLAGAQDNGSQQRTTSNTFARLIGGDGIAGAYDHTTPSNWLFSNFIVYQDSSGRYHATAAAAYTTNNGVSFAQAFVPPYQTDFTGFVAPMINDPNLSTRFYFGTQRVWRSDSDGVSGSWSPVSPNISTKKQYGAATTIITVAPSNSAVVYAGCADGSVGVTTNVNAATPTWTNITAGLPNLAVSGIAVDPTNPAIVYVGLNGFDSPHVWKSTNYGGTWTNISGHLPNAPVNSLVVDPINKTALYAATETGVFVTSDGGTTWAKYGTGLPTIQCLMLRANATTGYLSVATYGRGIWRIPLNTTTTAPPPTASLAGADLQFNGSSQNVTVPNFSSVAPTTEITIEFWQKVNAAQNQAAFSIGDYTSTTNRIACHTPWSDGNVYFDFGSLSTNGRLTYTPPTSLIGTWQHFALVASQAGNYMRIFRNGVLEAQKTGMTPFVRGTQPLQIGSGQGMDYFNGQIDEFRIWNRARSPREILSDYNATLYGNEPDLLAYYRFDEGTGSTTADATGHGYTGTLTNAPTWLASAAPVNTVHVPVGSPRTITLRAFNPTTNPLTYSIVSSPSAGTLTGTPPNVTYTPGSGYSGVDSFTYKANDGADSNVATVNITTGTPLVAVSGKITLQSYITNAQPITFQFRPTSGLPSFAFLQTPAADGTYTISTVPPGNYSLLVKGSKWLAKSALVVVGAGGQSGVNFTLPGGDADNNNVIDIGDFGILVNAYNGDRNITNSGYDARADFNGDGVIDIADFGILVNNYDAAGDN